MNDLTTSRRRAALLALALGGFAVGLTEFVAMGLLPEIAHGLLPGPYARSSSDAISRAGWSVSTYALGVVVGAPTIAVLAARVSRKRLVLGLLVLFVAGTVASALAPTFWMLLAARFIAGLPHGAYFGAAGILAARLMGPGNQARGFALVLAGLTTSNVIGVPLITSLGQDAGWRIAYLAIAAVFFLTLLAVWVVVPEDSAYTGGSPRAELGALRAPQVWMAAAVASIGFAGFFAVDSYLAPITTHVAGLPSTAVPWALVAVGLGMTVGNAVGGWSADRNLRFSLLLGFPCIVAALVVFALVAHAHGGLFVGAFLLGATSMFLGPALQARLIAVAPGAQLMGAAINQSAMNIANSLGAALGSVVIAQGHGYLAPSWLGALLGVVGCALTVVSFTVEGRSERTATAHGGRAIRPRARANESP
ncbi:MFS transporter, DHA1 family, inner membrane transport protein [Actinacidiphila yanglinensis]|uniref:MFS transporter, DHA1 family, inner membrane transport protein n=1 Tax=Actinacidiphila yanglinensis TaxID=310779 RepID=A0A1H6DHG2_9ACTN|nr:MFS transporter [Actinacidiphila yanglinensis]SEG84640.1 MFS transporter, DHA1 family, inner membrane transport protein [Actinacidiphila yanglinensis]